MNTLRCLLLLAAAMAIVYAICLMLATLAFWVVKVDNMSELFFAFFAAGRFPVSAFPAWVRLLLTFVVPIALAILAGLWTLRSMLTAESSTRASRGRLGSILRTWKRP